jgi:PAS domain S-box-containing protein
VLDHLPTLVSYVDSDRRYRYVNRAYEAWFGVSLAEITGRHLADVLGPAAYDQISPYASRALAGERVAFERTLSYQHGGARHVLAEYLADVDAEGAVQGFFALIHDITEIKRGELARASLSAIVESSGDAIYSYDFDGVILTWNRGAQDLYGYSEREIVGRSVDMIIPNERAGEANRVFVPAARRGDFIRNFETVRVRRNGVVFPALLTASPVRDSNGAPVAVSAIARDMTDRKRAEEKLAAATAKFESVFNQSGIFAGIMDLEGYLREANDLSVHWCGYTRADVLDLPFWETPWWRGSKEVQERLREAVRQATSGEAYRATLPYWLADGTERVVEFAMHPIRDSAGDLIFLHPTGIDVTDRKRREEQIRLLMSEVNHRSKNMLALVQAVARRTAAASPDDFIPRFEQRLHALAVSQDLLVNSEWRGVNLADLTRSQLGHFADLIGDRIRIDGPIITLSASAAQTLGMALHELGTNAGKYGALTNDRGCVEIRWNVESGEDGVAEFAMTWRERDGPTVAEPVKRGFGSTVLDTMARMTLNATIELKYAPSGISWRLTCPVSRVIAGGGDRTSRKAQSQALVPSGRRILLVEDEALVALEAAAALEAAGFAVVGPAASVAEAFELLDRFGCDCAVLDVNLGSETAEPIALRLTEEGVPFLTVSGYSRAQQPAVFKNAPFLAKPLILESLIAEIERHMEGRWRRREEVSSGPQGDLQTTN